MKLTTKGRYAVMALADLAGFDRQNPVPLRDIALRQNNDSVNSNGISSNNLPNFLTKDYRSLMKAIDNKKNGS